MLVLLKELCKINGASGDEKRVREYIIEKISGHCEYSVDALGSVIVFKKGRNTPARKIMISAHMDEVAFIITDITDDGYLKFQCVGGISAGAVIDREIEINGVKGVIGAKAVHLLSGDEKNKVPEISEMYIDIGAESKNEAQSVVSRGDFAYFSCDYSDFGNGLIKAKALDDRIGCMLMIELICSDLEYDTYFCFNTQEEVGLRGAVCTSYSVQSDISVVLEATTAADLCGVKGADRCCVLGEGPVVSFMDGRTVYDSELYALAFAVAEQNNIKIQTKTLIAGGNDAGAIQTSGRGSRVIAVSLPCRYIHSAAGVVNKSDIENTRKLLYALLPELYD